MTTGFFAYLMGRSPFGLRLRFSQRLIQLGRRSTKDVATDELSEDATTEGQRTLYGFRAVYVFDISQTEGRELPTLTEVQGDVSGYRERLVKFVETQAIALMHRGERRALTTKQVRETEAEAVAFVVCLAVGLP